MYIVLFNPLSKSGKKQKNILKTIKRMNIGSNYQLKNILELGDFLDYIKTLAVDDKIIIIGGDGTLHHVLNFLHGYDIKNEIFIYGLGTGNDFSRNVKMVGKLIPINQYLKKMPKIVINGVERYFINGAGMGLDAAVCESVNNAHGSSTFSYKLRSIMVMLKYKCADVYLTVDDKKYFFKKCWFVSVMNGIYQGGAMKFAPHAIMNDGIGDVCLVHGYSRLKTILLFPLIFFGLHERCKKVFTIQGKEIVIEAERPIPLQMDGEVQKDVLKANITM